MSRPSIRVGRKTLPCFAFLSIKVPQLTSSSLLRLDFASCPRVITSGIFQQQRNIPSESVGSAGESGVDPRFSRNAVEELQMEEPHAMSLQEHKRIFCQAAASCSERQRCRSYLLIPDYAKGCNTPIEFLCCTSVF